MPTISERQDDLKQKRSSALLSKLNILRQRDGSIIPLVKPIKDEDDLNLAMLFGSSRNENINWTAMGIEGLIRLYYAIIYYITGQQRNNIIVAGSGLRGGLTDAANLVLSGSAYKSGFFIGDINLQAMINEASGDLKDKYQQIMTKGLNAEFNVPMTDGWTPLAASVGWANYSSTFTYNIDAIPVWNPATLSFNFVLPPAQATLDSTIQSLLTLIGGESPIGPHTDVNSVAVYNSAYSTNTPVTWRSFVNDSILGKRFRDVAPYTVTTTGQYDEQQFSFGDGNWDNFETPLPPGYTPTPDAWDGNFLTILNLIITQCQILVLLIGYSKITNFTYIVNHKLVPGIDPNYNPNDPTSLLGSSWNMQNTWIETINAWIVRLQHSLGLITPYISGNSTSSAARGIINTELYQLKAYLPSMISSANTIATAVAGVFGDVTNPNSLYGHRYMWIRSILDSNEGSKIQLLGLNSVIQRMQKNINRVEAELNMYGLDPTEYIPTPEILGIAANPIVNALTFELEYNGWLVTWLGQLHCTGYDVWRSMDYNPSTLIGTWTKIEISHTNHTITDIDSRNGNVQIYIIDTDVPPIPVDVDQATVNLPYYRVKAYDDGALGDYARTVTASDYSVPKKPADFPFTGDGANTGGPRAISNDMVTTTPTSNNIPPNALAWVTKASRAKATDFDFRTFVSEAPFDSIASNLIVFINGDFKVAGVDFQVIDKYTIKLNSSLLATDQLAMVVFLRSFATNKNIHGVVTHKVDLPATTADGEVWQVEETNYFYQFVAANSLWVQIEDPNRKAVWRDPVNTFSQLPGALNSDGDIRLVLSDSILFRWDATNSQWAKISGGSGSGMLPPIETFDDLKFIETGDIANGTLIFISTEETMYRWSLTQGKWLPMANGANAAYGKNPVNTATDLPLTANSDGDIRLVLSENKIYRWSSSEIVWKVVKASVDLKHHELIETDWAVVEDHDLRYYTKASSDIVNTEFQKKLDYLYSIKPLDAVPLSGSFEITGATIYSGYLADGASKFITLQPWHWCNFIIKDGNFILSNNNVSQFANADMGVLKLFINDVQADQFDLGSWFDETKRVTGQTYPKKFGVKNIIEILSVGPYNQYATYQRADFQLNITQTLLQEGENSIYLQHVVDPLTTHATDKFIFFWDDFGGSMGFTNIALTQHTLQSNSYLSGIRYYSLNDSFDLTFIAENIFNKTYIETNQVVVNGSDFGIPSLTLNHHDSHVLGTIIPNENSNYSYLNTVTITNPNIQSVKPSLHITASNPSTKVTVDKAIQCLVNTMGQTSTDLVEYFQDEHYRLPVADYGTIPTIGTWDSTKVLGNQDLQTYGDALVYPSLNFKTIFPAQNITYQGLSGIRSYYRAFVSNTPRNNGKFKIEGFNTGDGTITVEIKLPSLTGWLNLTKVYNQADFSGINGDGCLVSALIDEYNWTTAGFSTAHCGGIVILRITTQSKSMNITKITLT
jgi:hypothetical protein